MAGSIDKSSPEYMFGQIITRLDQGDKTMIAHTKSLNEMALAVADLPCNHHAEQNRLLKEWQDEHDEKLADAGKAGLKLRHGLIIALVTGGMAAGITLGAQALM
jgi:hypothetical protein